MPVVQLQGYIFRTSNQKYHRQSKLDFELRPVSKLSIKDGTEWRVRHAGTRQDPRARARGRQETEIKLSGTLPETLRRELSAKLKARAKFKLILTEYPIYDWDETNNTFSQETIWVVAQTAPTFTLTENVKDAQPYAGEFLWEYDITFNRVTSEDTLET